MYENWASSRDTSAWVTCSPALNVLSTVPPLKYPLSFVRTKAEPLPGLTCRNSAKLALESVYGTQKQDVGCRITVGDPPTTRYGAPSISTVTPGRQSLEEMVRAHTCKGFRPARWGRHVYATWSVSVCTAQIVLAGCSFTWQAYVLQAWGHRST